MALIPHSFFPRSMFDYDTLDLFDPFDALDHNMCRNMLWVDQPSFLCDLVAPSTPKVPHKYRIKVDCHGYAPNSIKTDITADKSKLVLTAKEGEVKGSGDEDFFVKEFRRTYKLPPNVETDKMVSFVTRDGQFVVEFPIHEEKPKHKRDEEAFAVVTAEDGKKHIKLNLALPKNVEPANVKVTCKDRDVIVQAEDAVEKPDGFSKFYYYRRSTLPANTDFDALKCSLDKNHLHIEAPCTTEHQHSNRSVPIETTSQPAAIKNVAPVK